MRDQVNRYIQMYRDIMIYGTEIKPRGLDCREIEDLQIQVNPHYPFMTFTHRKYDVGYFKKEMMWKLTANKYDTSIQQHAKLWKEIINPDGTYNSNYGQFFFGPGYNVWDVVTELIRDPDSRKAIIPMLNVSHTAPHVVDTVCTEAVGFKIRGGRLNCSVHMRSSDVIFGLATDIPTFSFLYRLVLGLLHPNIPCDLGTITITAMSSHIYSRHYEMVQKILEDRVYELTEMPYCNCEEAMKIIASRGKPEILKTAGLLGEWLCQD
jgi:thymidylate synthase